MEKLFALNLFTAVMISVFTLSSQAEPVFSGITEEDMVNISKEMSANFTHNSMMGASKLGTIFGFQFGLTAAQTASPKVNAIAKRSGGSEVPHLYSGGLFGSVGIPFGIAAEVVLLPKTSSAGAHLTSNSFAVKWNINEVIPVL